MSEGIIQKTERAKRIPSKWPMNFIRKRNPCLIQSCVDGEENVK